MRCGTNRHNLCFIGVQLKLVAIHPDENNTNTCLNTGLNTVELIGRTTLGQLSVVCILVIITWTEIRSDKGCEYRVNKTGPNTEP